MKFSRTLNDDVIRLHNLERVLADMDFVANVKNTFRTDAIIESVREERKFVQQCLEAQVKAFYNEETKDWRW